MNIPETIEVVIAEFEQRKEPLDTHVVQAAISNARTKLEDKTPSGEAWADLAAFAFQSDQEDRQPWGTYFGPMGTWSMKDGSVQYSPDPRDVTPEMLEHWQERAESLSHPVLKSRYADLVWDFGHKVTKKRSDIRFARMAIDSYMASVLEKMNADDHDDVEALQRAIKLSTRIRDADRTAGAKAAMLAMFHVEVDKDGWWLRLFETLTTNKKCGLTDDEKRGMVEKLDALLAKHTNDTSPDPHGAERVANYIIPIYSATQNFDAVKRVGIAVSEAFEKMARSGSRMQAMAWLHTAAEFARRANDSDRYTRLKVERETAIKESASEMKSFEFSHEVKKAEVDEVIDALIDNDSWQQSLFNIAAQFIVAKSELQNQAERGAKQSPLMSAFTTSVTSGCAACVLVRDAPFEPGSLDRIGALRFLRNHLSFNLELSEEDRISKDSTIATSVLDEVERALREGQKPNLLVYLPAETDAGELAAWPLISVLDRWRLHGHAIGFVVSDEFMKTSDTAGRLALYDLGKRFATSATPFPLYAGPIPAACNGSKIGVAVSSNGASIVWASRDDRPWLPGEMWGAPVERPIVRGSVSLPRDITPLDEAALLPSPGSTYETITNELDRPASLFGTSMANRIRGLVAPLGLCRCLLSQND